MKIGLLFGSFNPIHIGHLIIANTFVENSDLEQVWFVVSPHNPKKDLNTLLHAHDRYDMVEKAIADNHKLRACDVEFHLPRPSYTVDTLVVLREKYPQHTFNLILGGDNLTNLTKWKNYEEILANHQVLVYPRPATSPSPLDTHPQIQKIDAPLLDISATYIRTLIQNQKSIKYLVPDEIATYIRLKKFYF
jgi:nicotinate-nucleotide adenylyltransferase